MKTNEQILNEYCESKYGYILNLSNVEKQRIFDCMDKAREDEINNFKDCLVPEEGHNCFNKDLFHAELDKCNERNFKPDQLDIHPDDFFQFCEMERLTGNVDPRRELHFGQNYFEGLKLNVDRDIKPGFWKLTKTQ